MTWETVFNATFEVDPAIDPIIIPYQFQPYYRLIVTAELLTGLGVREPFLGHLRQLLLVPGIGEVKGRSLAVVPLQQMFIPSTELPYKLVYQPVQRDFSLSLTIQVESSIISSGGTADNGPVLAAIAAVQTRLDNWTESGEATDYAPLFAQILTALDAVGNGVSALSGQVGMVVAGQADTALALASLQASNAALTTKADDILSVVTTPAATYEDETTALLESFAGTYSTARKNAINALIQGLKDDGIWLRLDRLYLAGLTEADSLLCWRSLVPATNVNGMAFVADRGFTGNGTDSYLNTHFNPVAANGSYSLNSATLGLWSRTNSSGSPSRDLGCRTAFNNDESVLILKESGSAYYALNADSNTSPVGMAESTGYFSNSRTAADLTTLYRNGASVTSTALASAQVPNQAFFLGALNSGGSPLGFTDRQYSCCFIGGGLTAQQHAILYARLNVYLTVIGAS